jgi:hypothetical protein
VPEYTKLIEKSRKERRAHLDSIPKYIELWREFSKEFEEVVNQSKKNVLAKLNIDEALWERSSNYYVEQNNQEIFMIQYTNAQKLKYLSLIFSHI